MADGVPGLSQKPIQPGDTFTYKWTATQYGTYWYHGHVRGQLEDGLFGPIHIKFVLIFHWAVTRQLISLSPTRNTPTPFNLISHDTNTLTQLENAARYPEIVLLSDWSHFTSEELHNVTVAADIDPL
jgi:hypothetical protein